MAKKPLKDILAGVRASKVVPGSTGSNPGVDYAPKAGDEGAFVSKHTTAKDEDRVGNKDDIYQATNIRHALLEPKEVNHRPAKRAEPMTKVKEETEELDEKHLGFKKLKSSLAHQKGVRDPGALAASIGRKKYGASKFQKAAGADHKLKEDDCSCTDTDDVDTKKKTGKKLLLGDKKKPVDESWITLNKETGKVTEFPGQKEAILHSNKTGEVVGATHGAMGLKASKVLGDPRDRKMGGTMTPSGFVKDPKPKKVKEDTDIDEGKIKDIMKAGAVTGMLGMNAGSAHNIATDTAAAYSMTQPAVTKALKLGKEALKIHPLNRGENEKARQAKYQKEDAQTVAVQKAVAKKKLSDIQGKKKSQDLIDKLTKKKNAPIKEDQIDEVLTKDDPAGKWIHDFVHSKDPKFAGKSPAKRKQQALAAYYAKQRNEDVAVPLLGSVSSTSKKTKKCKKENEQTDTPMTFPGMNVDVNAGRNV